MRGVELAGGHVFPRSAVFVVPEMVPRDTLLTGLGCERDPNGWVSPWSTSWVPGCATPYQEPTCAPGPHMGILPAHRFIAHTSPDR
ncbi:MULTISPECIES: hypothetical protein [Streptomyces]|uniref:hypothetical protein n=1 Tax=Streptomyces TaxID=1883 RepID=UPI00224EC82E|nr:MULTISPECIES: hypothetical protein [Streptomyces]MCX5446417.1 hypothetical protein [Streptomyces libani]WUB85102.1 hypothetical protein OG424_37230 [Streptomyces platensis]